ncbi:long-chain-fatty-acid--ligase 5 [Stylonychia lemnae]|uniref:Long-chain-fatty-acid--ligase 5 n=1 Tax=Stylonychia lemnae TaxID=5949 RepID=A0A078B0A0_STYLE|nr:long-chain-fatty-acid--ligase 5 [Stylonychia lemnae]|eukprot:CDW87746.1 long-chain-fatty-acid--ligase 5 [Stylonychia lemnae]
MGNTQTERQYAFFRTDLESIPGHSAELICAFNKDNPDREVPDDYQGSKTVWEIYKKGIRRFPNNRFLGTRNSLIEGRPYEWKTFREVYNCMEQAARGIDFLDLSPELTYEGKSWRFLGIHSRNREEWAVMDLACLRSGITIVPFFDSLGKDALAFVVNQTELQTMCIESKNFENLIKLHQEGKTPSLKNIVIFEGVSIAQRQIAQSLGIKILSYQDVIQTGDIHKEIVLVDPTPETIYMFCYTSGTTGDAKAAMISHKNIISFMNHMEFQQQNHLSFEETDILLSYLPLAHIFEQGSLLISLDKGYAHGYYSGDPLKLFEDIAVLKPTYFFSVPRVFTRIYQRVLDGVNQKGGMSKWLFEKAVRDKINTYLKTGNLSHKFYDKVVFKKVRDIFGGNVRQMLCGSACLDPQVMLFFKVAMGLPIFEGYSQTETVLCGTMTTPDNLTPGNVGSQGICNKFRLKDVPEMHYYHTDKPPRGELQTKGKGNIIGYYKNEEKTKELLTEDGWLNTGDVVAILENGNVQIIDRAKNIFKLSQGEYIAPEKLQNIYAQSVLVQQIYVHGESSREYLVALVVPDLDAIKKIAQAQSLTYQSIEDLLTSEVVKKAVIDEFNRMASNFSLTSLEKIKKVHLTTTVFSTENDLATPTMKVKRFNVRKYFEKELEELYKD